MREIVSKLKRKLKAKDQKERCGVLLKDGSIVEVDNKHPEPEKGFVIPGKIMIALQNDLMGTWHTHPGEKANLSKEDYRGFTQWPELKHFIVGTDGVRGFEVVGELIVEIDL